MKIVLFLKGSKSLEEEAVVIHFFRITLIAALMGGICAIYLGCSDDSASSATSILSSSTDSNDLYSFEKETIKYSSSSAKASNCVLAETYMPKSSLVWEKTVEGGCDVAQEFSQSEQADFIKALKDMGYEEKVLYESSVEYTKSGLSENSRFKATLLWNSLDSMVAGHLNVDVNTFSTETELIVYTYLENVFSENYIQKNVKFTSTSAIMVDDSKAEKTDLSRNAFKSALSKAGIENIESSTDANTAMTRCTYTGTISHESNLYKIKVTYTSYSEGVDLISFVSLEKSGRNSSSSKNSSSSASTYSSEKLSSSTSMSSSGVSSSSVKSSSSDASSSSVKSSSSDISSSSKLSSSSMVSSSNDESSSSQITFSDENFEYNYPANVTYGSLTDERDDQIYRTVVIGSQVWMAENLNYNYNSGTETLSNRGVAVSYCADGSKDGVCQRTGRFYNWAAAVDADCKFLDEDSDECWSYQRCRYGRMEDCEITSTSVVRGVCPQGWHLPNSADFSKLISTIKKEQGDSKVDKYLKSSAGWVEKQGLDTYGFAVLPVGQAMPDNENKTVFKYRYSGERALFWTSEIQNAALGFVYVRYFSFDDDYPSKTEVYADGKYSVRCVKD